MVQSETSGRPATRLGTEAARTAFLYGTGNGERVLTIKELARIGGVSTVTIGKHIPAWEREFASLCATKGHASFELFLSAETLAQHAANLQSWKELDDELLAEIKELPKITKFLRSTIEWFREHGDKGDVQDVKTLVDSFLRTIGARKSLISQRLAVNARWNQGAGIDEMRAVAGTRAKTMETGRAKLELDKERQAQGLRPADEKPTIPPQLLGRQYKRKGEAVAIEAEEDLGFGDLGEE